MNDDASPLAEQPEWMSLLTEGHRPILLLRSILWRLPADPRCKICNSPFRSVGGRIAGLAGFRPSRQNPAICGKCCERLGPGGATVDVAVLFADVRGSTELGASMTPAGYAGRMSDFYRESMAALLPHGALIDKFVGDEVMALFLRGTAGPDYRALACRAALALQKAVGPREGRPVLPVGIGLHAGDAYVGNVAESGMVDFTALGDTVNTAAGLQAYARPGELVMSEAIYASIAGERPGLPTDVVHLKGKAEPFPVRVVRPA